MNQLLAPSATTTGCCQFKGRAQSNRRARPGFELRMAGN